MILLEVNTAQMILDVLYLINWQEIRNIFAEF